MMQAVHHFLNTAGIVPPMNIEDVDVACAQLLERFFDGDVQRFHIVADERGLLGELLGWDPALEVCGVLHNSGQFHVVLAVVTDYSYLGSDDELMADAPLFHPLSDELLGEFILAIARSADGWRLWTHLYKVHKR